jgi:hypothetical protein
MDHLDKVPLLSFSGRPEDFHKFKREFVELTFDQGYTPALWLAQLLRCMTSMDTKKDVEGHTSVEEAWLELSRRYGSRDMAIASAKDNLLNIKLQGLPHKHVEALLQAMRRAHTSL